MKKALYLSILLVLIACNAKPAKQSRHSKSSKDSVAVSFYSGRFDLAKLLLKEDLPAIIAVEGIKSEPVSNEDLTLAGFEVLRSSDPKVLRFSNVDFSGTNGKDRNHILFHYGEKSKLLACYELKVYNQKQTDKLIRLLDKAGKLSFKQTRTPKGSIAIDLNGDEIKPENVERKTFRVWENNSTGITYFLSETGSEPKLTTELIVLKRDTQFGKDWIQFLELNWYRYEKTEPL